MKGGQERASAGCCCGQDICRLPPLPTTRVVASFLRCTRRRPPPRAAWPAGGDRRKGLGGASGRVVGARIHHRTSIAARVVPVWHRRRRLFGASSRCALRGSGAGLSTGGLPHTLMGRALAISRSRCVRRLYLGRCGGRPRSATLSWRRRPWWRAAPPAPHGAHSTFRVAAALTLGCAAHCCLAHDATSATLGVRASSAASSSAAKSRAGTTRTLSSAASSRAGSCSASRTPEWLASQADLGGIRPISSSARFTCGDRRGAGGGIWPAG